MSRIDREYSYTATDFYVVFLRFNLCDRLKNIVWSLAHLLSDIAQLKCKTNIFVGYDFFTKAYHMSAFSQDRPTWVILTFHWGNNDIGRQLENV